VKYYRELLGQTSRIEPFRRAIKMVVRPDDRVLEIGTGLGTYSFFAADSGAERVWAVEGAPVVHIAEAVARMNGYHGRVEFIRGWVPEVEIPDRASVLIFEDFPSRLLDAQTFRLLTQVWEKHLTADARVLPNSARLRAVPVYASPEFVPSIASLDGESDVSFGIDWAATREYVLNTVHRVNLNAETLTLDPANLADTSFGSVPKTEDLGGSAQWECDRDVMFNGIAYWFDLELIRGEWLYNAPGQLPCSWGQLFLPIDPPLHAASGDVIELEVRPERLADGAPGWLSWWARVGGVEARGHEFKAQPAAFRDLYHESPDSVPRLNRKGRATARALQLSDGSRSVLEIAEILTAEFGTVSALDNVRTVLSALAGNTDDPGPLDSEPRRSDNDNR